MTHSYDPRKLQQFRLERGWSMGELARRTGLRQPSIWALENGKVKKPKFDTLATLAAAYGVPVQELQKGPMQPDHAQKITAMYGALSPVNQEALFNMARVLLKSQK